VDGVSSCRATLCGSSINLQLIIHDTTLAASSGLAGEVENFTWSASLAQRSRMRRAIHMCRRYGVAGAEG
jgi:hypothetical protein